MVDLVKKIADACRFIDGVFAEKGNKVICDLEDIKLVYNKREGWAKYYQDGLKIWGDLEDVSHYKTEAFVFGERKPLRCIAISFKDPNVDVEISCVEDGVCFAPLFFPEERLIGKKYMEKHREMAERARKAREAKYVFYKK